MTETQEQSARAAHAGAAMLDRVAPGWAEEIDTRELIMSSGRYCILGQLYGSYEHGRLVLMDHDVTFSASRMGFDVAERGFDVAERFRDFRTLQDAWLYEIAQRMRPPTVMPEPVVQPESELVLA